MNTLESDKVKLRALEPEDAELLYVWENDTDIWQAGETLTPFSRHTFQQYIATASLDIYEAKQLRLMIDIKDCETPVTIGSIDLFDFNPYHKRAAIGILIYNPQNRNKGYASQALQLLIQYAFDVLQLHQLHCGVAYDNDVSIKLFQNAGFEITGLKKGWLNQNKIWKDEYILQLINKDF